MGLQFYSTPEKPQHMKALDKANAKRMAARKFKADIRAMNKVDGARFLADFLDLPVIPEGLDALKLDQTLMAVPAVGENKAALIMRGADVRVGSRRIRDVPKRQRHVMAESLRYLAERREERDR
jgi:hypothetical protein